MTDPTREAFAVDEDTINLALDAWFAGDCSRPHYDEHIDQMRAAASVIVAALSARAQGEADNGPWRVTNEGRCIASDDFTHDVVLNISGDFETATQQLAYAEHVCAQLNNTTPAVRAVDLDGFTFTADEVHECIDHLKIDGPRLIPDEIMEQMRTALLALTQPEAE